MQKTLTHYEQLNVARDATPEQIKRAYRKLAQQLHPDRNPAANAEELMSMVNASHEVLASPAKRAVYDAQLVQSERQARGASAQVVARQGAAVYAAAARSATPRPAPAASKARSAGKTTKKPGQAKVKPKRRRMLRWLLLFALFCAGGAWMGYDRNAGLSYTPTEALPVANTWVKPDASRVEASAQAQAQAVVVAEPEAQCVVPQADPMGAAWPQKAGYLQGMPMRKDTGWSQIVIDNAGGKSAVYAKVTDAVGRNAYRHVYIPAGGQFTFARMDAGYYLLKYQMLDTGCAFASSRILLEETPMGSQIKSSVYRLPLSKLQDRGASPARLKPDQF